MKIKLILKRLFFAYQVVVKWEGETYIHWAKTLRGAREWMGCYPRDAGVAIVQNGTGCIVEARHACYR